MVNFGQIHYRVDCTGRNRAGKTKENPEENCFKPELSFEITRKEENERILKELLYENACRTGVKRTRSNTFG